MTITAAHVECTSTPHIFVERRTRVASPQDCLAKLQLYIGIDLGRAVGTKYTVIRK